MGINPSDLNLKTPLIKYLATAIKYGANISKKGDVKMSIALSKRMAVGIDDTRSIYVAMQSDEAFVFQEFIVSEVSFVRNVSDSDWLVITTKDASNGRGKSPKGLGNKEIPLRFWYPANKGTFDGFYGISEDKTINFIEMTFVNNHPEASGTPFMEVPLKLRGKWDDVEYIEEENAEEEIIERVAPTGADDILAGEDSLDLLAENPSDLVEDVNFSANDIFPDDL